MSKNILKLFISVLCLMASSVVSADFLGNIRPQIGVDYRYSNIRGHDDWAKLLAQDLQGVEPYLGARLYKYFGFNFGWSGQGAGGKAANFGPPGSLFGTTLTASNTISNKVSLEGWFFDLNAYWPFRPCWDLLATAGYGTYKPWLDIEVDVKQQPIPNALSSTSGRRRGIFRLGLGGQYMVTRMMGLRLVGRWMNTSNIKVRGNADFETNAINDEPYENSWGLTLGFFFQF